MKLRNKENKSFEINFYARFCLCERFIYSIFYCFKFSIRKSLKCEKYTNAEELRRVKNCLKKKRNVTPWGWAGEEKNATPVKPLRIVRSD